MFTKEDLQQIEQQGLTQAQVEQQIEQNQQDIQQAQRAMQRLDNLDSLERFAREEYYMHADNEDVYLVD